MCQIDPLKLIKMATGQSLIEKNQSPLSEKRPKSKSHI